MKTTRVIGTSLILIVIFSGVKLEGQDAPPANPYSGDLWKRSTLSGDWWGLRNDLAAKGVTIDMSLTQSAQGIVHGGKDTGWQYGGGRSDIFFNLDTQKLGLWPGGSFNLEAEGNFIPADNLVKSINGRAGSLMFVNSSQIYPTSADDNLTFLGEGRVRTNFFGLTGHQDFGAAFSNRKFGSIDQSARFIFENGAFEN